MEHRSIADKPVELREKDGIKGISGYAAVFNSLSHDLGGYREKIHPKAFDRTLKEIRDGKRVVSARTQHEGGLSTVGTTSNGSLRLEKDGIGLHYDISPLPNTSAGRDTAELVASGYINKSSFAFRVPDPINGMRWDFSTDPPTRELLDVDLVDVAPVDGPAYESTSVEARNMALASMKRAQDGEAGDVTLYVLDEIVPTWMSRYMGDAVSSGKVIEALDAVPDAKSIKVVINSPGGDVFEAMTIYNTLRAHPARVNVEIRGLAASAAATVAMAGDQITIGAGGFLMIHNAWTIGMGDARELRKQASLLDKIDGEYAEIIAARTGNDKKLVQKWMNAETWFTVDEAIQHGFATAKVGEADPIDGERCALLGYRNVPAEFRVEVPAKYQRRSLTTDDYEKIIRQSLQKTI